MARKVIEVTITDRGEVKLFRITEMSARAAEDWALELFFKMANSGIDIPDNLTEMGFAGLAQVGLQSLGKIPYDQAKPLLEKMLKCVQILPNPNNKLIVRDVIDEDFEDVSTIFKLRKEVVALHMDFLSTVKA